MSDPQHPGVITRVRARFHGERDAAALEALRAVGAGVYEELEQVERLRIQLLIDGGDLWTARAGVGGHMLAVWNAFVLHTLGGALLDADYAAHTGTVGYVPPTTFDQVWSWFSTAADWLSQARQASSNPDYDTTAMFALPATLPGWSTADPCPATHLWALRDALPVIRERGEVAFFDLDRQSAKDDQRRAVNVLKQMIAQADAAADYASVLAAGTASGQLRELIETHFKRAVTLWYEVGQLAVVPRLISHQKVSDDPILFDTQRLPGGARFDPWCLTHPDTVDRWRNDSHARKAVKALWVSDPDPARTLAIKDEIDAALADKSIVALQRGDGIYHYRCPWSPVYRVRKRVTIGGRTLSAPQQFAYDVSADDTARGGPFVRRIVIGPFQSTDEVDYGGGTQTNKA